MRRIHNLTRTLQIIGAVAACAAACVPTQSGELEILSNGSVAFQSTTGISQSFFSSDLALGPAQDISFDSSRLVVHYTDNFSTFNADKSVGSSQEEVIVFARDPNEYRATLESIVGPDPTINGIDPGNFLEWSRQTFAPKDVWPIVQNASEPITLQPDGVMLPFAMGLPYPVGSSPQTDWQMTRAMFTGSSSTPFAGAAASFNGSIKGITLARHGVCAFEESIGDSLSSLTSSIPKSINVVPAEIDVADLGVGSFVSYQNAGGFVLTSHIDVLERTFEGPIPIFTTASADINSTYWFQLDDGIVTISPTSNVYNWGGLDFYGINGMISGMLDNVAVNRVKLSALEGQRGKFTGGQAQPIPVTLPAAGVDCSDTSKQRPASCFTMCTCPSGGCSDGTDMNNPGSWPETEDAGDDSRIDPAAWHNKDYCQFSAAALSGLVRAGATGYADMTANGPADLGNTIIEDMPGDPSKFHNIRCNFHPRYESGTNVSTDPMTTGNPFGANQKHITTGAPVCELIVRVKRLNVMPDAVEAVFFDGSDLAHAESNQFGNFASPVSSDIGVGNEAFAAFLGVKTVAPSAITQLCNRGPAMGAVTRPFAHVLVL